MDDVDWTGTAGSRQPRVIIVGEAWGAEEARFRTPFCGQSGRELFRMLGEALGWESGLLREALSARDTSRWISLRDEWLRRTRILLTNVVSSQPPANDFTHFLYPTQEAKSARNSDWNGIYPRPLLLRGIDSLLQLIAALNPDIIVCAGNWPLFILTSHSEPRTKKGYKLPVGIATWRGSQTWTDDARLGAVGTGSQHVSPPRVQAPIPVLPIIHPAAILRDWGWRHITVHDLRSRLGRFITGTLSWRPPTTLDNYRPTLGEVRKALDGWLARATQAPLWLAVDIETYAKRFITCIGFCDGQLALCIPVFYFDSNARVVDYWTSEEEFQIWMKIRALLHHPNTKIIGQNFIYDTQYLHRDYHIDAIVAGDTMVGHHVLWPGTPKSLEVLASLYNHHYCYWKDESEEWAADAMGAEDLWRYNCKDTRSTFEAWTTIWATIKHFNKEPLYADRMDQWELSREMTLRGVAEDPALRAQMIQHLYRQMNRVETWMLAAVPEAWRYTQAMRPWFTSSKLTGQILYELCGIKPILHKVTKQPTTDDTAINELCERADTQWLAPLLLRLRDYRSAQVILANHLEIRLNPFGRLVTQFNIAQPETFRWSSSKNAFGEGANLQNLAKVED